MKKEESETRLDYGTSNLERRKHPRFNVDLPIEYSPTGIFVKHGRAVNASEGWSFLSFSIRSQNIAESRPDYGV